MTDWRAGPRHAHGVRFSTEHVDSGGAAVRRRRRGEQRARHNGAAAVAAAIGPAECAAAVVSFNPRCDDDLVVGDLGGLALITEEISISSEPMMIEQSLLTRFRSLMSIVV